MLFVPRECGTSCAMCVLVAFELILVDETHRPYQPKDLGREGIPLEYPKKGVPTSSMSVLKDCEVQFP